MFNICWKCTVSERKEHLVRKERCLIASGDRLSLKAGRAATQYEITAESI